MNRIQRTGAALASVLLTIAGVALAGDDTKGSVAYAAEKKGDCACDVCALFQADAATVVGKVAAGAAPATFCDGTPPAQAAWLRAHPARLFAKSIGARPAEIGPMLASVHARFVDPATTDEQRTRLLDLVVYFPKQANDRIVPELWKVAPAAFTTDQLTALAQYGPEPMTAELRNRAKREVLAAAYFGVRGDNCGEATLKATFRKLDVAHGVIAEPALGALGLAGLGNDKPLLGLQGALRDAAIAALDAGRLDAAKSAVLSAQWIDKLAHAPEKAELGWLADSLEWFALSRGAQLASADDVFKLIEELKT